MIAEVGRSLRLFLCYKGKGNVVYKTVTVKLGCYWWGADILIMDHGD